MHVIESPGIRFLLSNRMCRIAGIARVPPDLVQIGAIVFFPSQIFPAVQGGRRPRAAGVLPLRLRRKRILILIC